MCATILVVKIFFSKGGGDRHSVFLPGVITVSANSLAADVEMCASVTKIKSISSLKKIKKS